MTSCANLTSCNICHGCRLWNLGPHYWLSLESVNKIQVFVPRTIPLSAAMAKHMKHMELLFEALILCCMAQEVRKPLEWMRCKWRKGFSQYHCLISTMHTCSSGLAYPNPHPHTYIWMCTCTFICGSMGFGVRVWDHTVVEYWPFQWEQQKGISF